MQFRFGRQLLIEPVARDDSSTLSPPDFLDKYLAPVAASRFVACERAGAHHSLRPVPHSEGDCLLHAVAPQGEWIVLAACSGAYTCSVPTPAANYYVRKSDSPFDRLPCGHFVAFSLESKMLGGGLDPTSLQVPQPGDHTLNILTPTLLELVLVNTKQPSPARVDTWDWVDDNEVFSAPDLSKIIVRVNGQARGIASVGFKRRPLYAPLLNWDLHIGNYLYLRLTERDRDGQSVTVTNDGTVWPVESSSAQRRIRYGPVRPCM